MFIGYFHITNCLSLLWKRLCSSYWQPASNKASLKHWKPEVYLVKLVFLLAISSTLGAYLPSLSTIPLPGLPWCPVLNRAPLPLARNRVIPLRMSVPPRLLSGGGGDAAAAFATCTDHGGQTGPGRGRHRAINPVQRTCFFAKSCGWHGRLTRNGKAENEQNHGSSNLPCPTFRPSCWRLAVARQPSARGRFFQRGDGPPQC